MCACTGDKRRNFNYIFERKQLSFIGSICIISFQSVPGTYQRLLGFSLNFRRKKQAFILRVLVSHTFVFVCMLEFGYYVYTYVFGDCQNKKKITVKTTQLTR